MHPLTTELDVYGTVSVRANGAFHVMRYRLAIDEDQLAHDIDLRRNMDAA